MAYNVASMYHTACAVKAHAQYMEPQARQRWTLLLDALSKSPPKGAPVPTDASSAQRAAYQRVQACVKELETLLTKRGDPFLSLKQLDKLEENFGERQPGLEHELLPMPDPIF